MQKKTPHAAATNEQERQCEAELRNWHLKATYLGNYPKFTYISVSNNLPRGFCTNSESIVRVIKEWLDVKERLKAIRYDSSVPVSLLPIVANT
jgi:hypothetical protein